MIYQRGQLRWIESMGGPLILLSTELLAAWSGHDLDEEEIEGQPFHETDYERACAVDGYIGVVTVADGYGLVLGDAPMSTAWWSLTETEGISVRWVYGDGNADIVSYLERIEEDTWHPSGISFEIGGSPLYLFDAAMAGKEADEHLIITLDKGWYDIDTGIVHLNDHTELIVHRLRRQ